MAYLRSIIERCQHGGCTSRATEQLCNWQNARNGVYCTKHAKQHLAAQQRLEDAERDRVRAREEG